MTLAAGTRLGTYEITGELGAGGMGEVYRATDTKLGREVAIKTLPSALAKDSDRLARFEREAKLLAALNHAHIAAIYGLDEHEGTQYLAMELVEGETLEEKLDNGPLPVADALHLALQIAEALEAAHEKGVVHRDLKPANVMVTGDGQVKVLDFGLAKAFSGDPNEASPAHSPALSVAMTQQGLILGTAGYMSPEQASGQPTDQRADIWAFGVVLYEMLTGLPPFSGESVPHILAAVLQTDPDWNRLPKNLHPRLKLLLERCLEKKVRNRYHSIADVRVDIEKILSDPQGATAAPIAQPASRRALPLAAGLVIGAALAGLAAFGLRPAPKPQRVDRFDWQLPQDQYFSNPAGSVLALSPDGRYIVYAATNGLYLRSMSELAARRIPSTEKTGAGRPFFSPDGRSVAYWSFDGQLKRIAIGGGAPVVIADSVPAPFGASWARDDTILYGQWQGIFRVPAAGGPPKLVVPAKTGEEVYGPRLLPDGDSVLFSVTTNQADWDKAQVVVQSLSTGKRTVLIKAGSDARYVSPGYLVYALGGQLFAVAFDAGTLTVSGAAVPVAQGVMRARFRSTGTANYGVAADGTLVYVSGKDPASGLRTRLVWVDREGHEKPLGLDPCACLNPAVSPDGTRVALQMLRQNASGADIWVWSLAQHTPMRLTFEAGLQDGPLWTADSNRIAYRGGRGGGISLRDADGTGVPERLVPAGTPWAWAPDGNLIFSEGGNPGNRFGVLPTGGDRKPRFILPTTSNEWSAALSPDGHWLAYQSDETGGRYEIYVRPFPNVNGGQWQISTDGGQEPKWAHDGHTLFFLGPKSLMATTIETTSTSTFGFRTPEAVLDRSGYLFTQGPPRSYDVSPDGKQFLLVKRITTPNATAGVEQERPRIVIVQHWLAALERKVAAK